MIFSTLLRPDSGAKAEIAGRWVTGKTHLVAAYV
jgi:hypothetical protein